MPTPLPPLKYSPSGLPPGLTPIDNTHKVPKRQWKKWGEAARRRFNQLFELMTDHQNFFTHPKAAEIPASHWRTTAWNAAFMAADMAATR